MTKVSVKRLKGLRPNLRVAQSPLDNKGRVENTLNSRNCGSCESAEVTRTESGIHVSGRAGEKRGRNC